MSTDVVFSLTINDAPCELRCGIREFWPDSEWDNAARISWLESKWNPFAVADTRRVDAPCGTRIYTIGGIDIFSEYSLGYFQLNACDFPTWPAERFFNARHNAGTAHDLWSRRGWSPWFLSATTLGLL